MTGSQILKSTSRQVTVSACSHFIPFSTLANHGCWPFKQGKSLAKSPALNHAHTVSKDIDPPPRPSIPATRQCLRIMLQAQQRSLGSRAEKELAYTDGPLPKINNWANPTPAYP